ncbi:MAG TPA: flagellar export protein FliJ [Symbiobacteriaceae bacterium]|nr:flagellar export protein FliJ [Symbiobacteriaceae bacterium]
MKKFQFSLQKLLGLRHQETEQAKRSLAAALAAEAMAQDRLEQAQSRLAERIALAAAGGYSVASYRQDREWIRFLQGEVEKAEQHLQEAQAETARLRQLLLVARQRERILEKLRERRLEAYQLEVLLEEQRELDERGQSPRTLRV